MLLTVITFFQEETLVLLADSLNWFKIGKSAYGFSFMSFLF